MSYQIGKDLEKLKLKYIKQVQSLEKKPLRNRGKIKILNAKIAAIQEGQSQSVLTSSVTGTSSTSTNIDKNNYSTYSAQIKTINEMYNNETSYGGELLRSLLDIRVSFISGSGITVKTKNKKLAKWINNFLKYNKLKGSKLHENVLCSEMEGKRLLTVFPDMKNEQVRVRSYSYYKTPYNIQMDDKDNEKIKSVTYQKNENETGEQIAKPENIIYVKIGGSPDRINLTVPRVANSLTDIENASRAKYDLRQNSHLFARTTAYFKTQTIGEAKAINTQLAAADWDIGKSFAGTADFSLVEPSGRATKALMDEILQAIKLISSNMGIPLQWLAYPDVLSNRAVADSMIEAVNAATIKERMIWEESLTELIIKAMEIAYERKWLSEFKPNDFEIQLPMVSFALLEQIQKIWLPLAEMYYVSKDTVRSMLPGIDPTEEKKLIQQQETTEMILPNIKIEEDIETEDDDDEKSNS